MSAELKTSWFSFCFGSSFWDLKNSSLVILPLLSRSYASNLHGNSPVLLPSSTSDRFPATCRHSLGHSHTCFVHHFTHLLLVHQPVVWQHVFSITLVQDCVQKIIAPRVWAMFGWTKLRDKFIHKPYTNLRAVNFQWADIHPAPPRWQNAHRELRWFVI